MSDPYRAVLSARFVQIAVHEHALYALDADGVVWRYESTGTCDSNNVWRYHWVPKDTTRGERR